MPRDEGTTEGPAYTEVRWLMHGQPIPEGWALAANEGRIRDHHAHYARMIVREIRDENADR
jgi:hypothetical protein